MPWTRSRRPRHPTREHSFSVSPTRASGALGTRRLVATSRSTATYPSTHDTLRPARHLLAHRPRARRRRVHLLRHTPRTRLATSTRPARHRIHRRSRHLRSHRRHRTRLRAHLHRHHHPHHHHQAQPTHPVSSIVTLTTELKTCSPCGTPPRCRRRCTITSITSPASVILTSVSRDGAKTFCFSSTSATASRTRGRHGRVRTSNTRRTRAGQSCVIAAARRSVRQHSSRLRITALTRRPCHLPRSRRHSHHRLLHRLHRSRLHPPRLPRCLLSHRRVRHPSRLCCCPRAAPPIWLRTV